MVGYPCRVRPRDAGPLPTASAVAARASQRQAEEQQHGKKREQVDHQPDDREYDRHTEPQRGACGHERADANEDRAGESATWRGLPKGAHEPCDGNPQLCCQALDAGTAERIAPAG
jgi:hypothetical protein